MNVTIKVWMDGKLIHVFLNVNLPVKLAEGGNAYFDMTSWLISEPGIMRLVEDDVRGGPQGISLEIIPEPGMVSSGFIQRNLDVSMQEAQRNKGEYETVSKYQKR